MLRPRPSSDQVAVPALSSSAPARQRRRKLTLTGLALGAALVVAGGTAFAVRGTDPTPTTPAAVAKALGAQPVILTGTRDNRLEIGKRLGADHVINVRNEDAVETVRKLTGGKGADFVVEARCFS